MLMVLVWVHNIEPELVLLGNPLAILLKFTFSRYFYFYPTLNKNIFSRMNVLLANLCILLNDLSQPERP